MRWFSKEKPLPNQNGPIKIGEYGNILVPLGLLWNSRTSGYPTTVSALNKNPLIHSPIAK